MPLPSPSGLPGPLGRASLRRAADIRAHKICFTSPIKDLDEIRPGARRIDVHQTHESRSPLNDCRSASKSLQISRKMPPNRFKCATSAPIARSRTAYSRCVMIGPNVEHAWRGRHPDSPLEGQMTLPHTHRYGSPDTGSIVMRGDPPDDVEPTGRHRSPRDRAAAGCFRLRLSPAP
jgi:hypothetical protein